MIKIYERKLKQVQLNSLNLNLQWYLKIFISGKKSNFLLKIDIDTYLCPNKKPISTWELSWNLEKGTNLLQVRLKTIQLSYKQIENSRLYYNFCQVVVRKHWETYFDTLEFSLSKWIKDVRYFLWSISQKLGPRHKS